MLFLTNQLKFYYTYFIKHICLYFLIEYIVLFYVGRSIVKLCDYYFQTSMSTYYFWTTFILLIVGYLLTYYFCSVRKFVIDFCIRLLFNPFTLQYVQLTQKIILTLMKKHYILFLILVNGYLAYLSLYYLEVVWFHYSINLNLTIALYHLLYSVRTFLFLPSFVIGVIINHPKSDDLFKDFAERNPNSFIMGGLDVLPPVLKVVTEALVKQVEQVTIEHPRATVGIGLTVALGATGKHIADSHADSQQKIITIIDSTVNQGQIEFGLKFPVQSPELAASRAAYLIGKEKAQVSNMTGMQSIYDSGRSFFTGTPSNVEQFQETAEQHLRTMSSAGSSFASSAITKGSIANSSKEYSLVEVFYSWLF